MQKNRFHFRYKDSKRGFLSFLIRQDEEHYYTVDDDSPWVKEKFISKYLKSSVEIVAPFFTYFWAVKCGEVPVVCWFNNERMFIGTKKISKKDRETYEIIGQVNTPICF